MTQILDIRNIIIRRLIDQLAELDSNMPKWISVNDELPNEYDDVLLTNGYQIFIGHLFNKEEKFWWVPPELKIKNLEYWMPLPLPPDNK